MRPVRCRMALRCHTSGARWSGSSRTIGAASRSAVVQSRRAKPSCAGFLCTWVALAAIPVQCAVAASFGGEVALTSDYIYRGLSESAGHAAVQVDLHASSAAGTFVGAWGSTRDHKLDPQGDYEVQLYLGHRLNLTSAWSTTLTAISYSYVGDSEAI